MENTEAHGQAYYQTWLSFGGAEEIAWEKNIQSDSAMQGLGLNAERIVTCKPGFSILNLASSKENVSLSTSSLKCHSQFSTPHSCAEGGQLSFLTLHLCSLLLAKKMPERLPEIILELHSSIGFHKQNEENSSCVNWYIQLFEIIKCF